LSGQIDTASFDSSSFSVHRSRTMGDVEGLTRVYCPDLQLPEGPKRARCYRNLGRRSLGHGPRRQTHSQLGCCAARHLAPCSSSFLSWNRVRLCSCLEASRTGFCLTIPRDNGCAPGTQCQRNSIFRGRLASRETAVGGPAACCSPPIESHVSAPSPCHPRRRGVPSLTRGFPALLPHLAADPLVEGSPGSCLFPSCTHLCLSVL